MPDRHTLAETEKAMREHVEQLPLDMGAANALSSLYRAANAVRNRLTQTVLRPHDLTWTGFVVLWVVWIWDDVETRHTAEAAGISKATLTGVVKTLETRGWIERRSDDVDRRLVHLTLTPSGIALMQELYPQFNAVEAQIVSPLANRTLTEMTKGLRNIVTALEDEELAAS